MARYRTIDIRIWMDAKFMSLDEGSQLLFIYLLTCPQINQIGTIPMSPNVLAAYLNKPIETVSERLKNLSDMGLIRVDNGNLIWICNFLKYNAPMNLNCAKGLLAFFDEIPDCPLVDEVAESVVKACELKGSDYLDAVFPALKKYLDRKEKRNHSETVPKPYRNQEQEQEQEQDKKVVVAPKAKREPTLSFPDSLPAEWRQAALQIRSDVTPERVFLKLRSRYAPTTAKKTMGNWRKIFLGWIGREYPETGTTSGKAPLPPHKDPAFHFGKEYYDKSVNPDGTTNWGV